MSELSQRLPSTKKQPRFSTKSDSDPDSDSDHDRPTTALLPTDPNNQNPPPPSPPSFAERAMSQTLTSTAHLANLLPTGTLLAFQLLTPVFTNNGHCDVATRPMTALLLVVLALSCFIASFTDSFGAPDGQVYYGLATFKGLYLFDYVGSSPRQAGIDLTKYKIRFIDWVHAVSSIIVFGVVALRDKNVVNCFYPMPSHEVQEVLDILPIGVGLICSLLFVVFPTRRHGIGYPVTPGK